MRNGVLRAAQGGDHDAVLASVEQMVADVARYVPGYQLKTPR
jgi:acetaldehyde dehydrogenase (acetylating)